MQQLLAVTRRRDLADDPELTGPLTSSLAIICAYAGRGPEAIEWAHRALSEQTPSPAVALTARQGLALGLAQCGREREAIEALSSPSLSPANPPAFDVELVITRGAIKAQAGDLRGAVDDLTDRDRMVTSGRSPRVGCPTRTRRWRTPSIGSAAGSTARRTPSWRSRWRATPIRSGSCRSRTPPRACSTSAGASGRRPSSTCRTPPRPRSLRRCRWRCSPRGALPRTWRAPAANRTARWSCSRRSGASCPRRSSRPLRRRTYELEAEALLQAGRLDQAAELLDRSRADSAGWWRLSAVLAYARGDVTQARDAFVADRMRRRSAIRRSRTERSSSPTVTSCAGPGGVAPRVATADGA